MFQVGYGKCGYPLVKKKMAGWKMDRPFEDVFPIENGGFSIAMLVYWRVDAEACFTKFQRSHTKTPPARN